MIFSPALRSGAPGLPGSLVFFSSPYSVEQYVGQEGENYDLQCFVLLASYAARLSIIHSHHARHAAAVA